MYFHGLMSILNDQVILPSEKSDLEFSYTKGLNNETK